MMYNKDYKVEKLIQATTLLLLTELEVLRALNRQLLLNLAFLAFSPPTPPT